jgi:arylsulfatase
MDGETAVSKDYKQGENKFTGIIEKITINIDPSKLSKEDQEKVAEAAEEAAAIQD